MARPVGHSQTGHVRKMTRQWNVFIAIALGIENLNVTPFYGRKITVNQTFTKITHTTIIGRTQRVHAGTFRTDLFSIIILFQRITGVFRSRWDSTPRISSQIIVSNLLQSLQDNSQLSSIKTQRALGIATNHKTANAAKIARIGHQNAKSDRVWRTRLKFFITNVQK